MAITVGGTTITFNDGTTQTTAAGGAPTTAQVLSATAGANYGDVGSYVFAVAAANTNAGSTVSGGSIRAVGVGGTYVSSSGINGYMGIRVGSTFSGTRRAMGVANTTPNLSSGCSTYSVYSCTLFLRIS